MKLYQRIIACILSMAMVIQLTACSTTKVSEVGEKAKETANNIKDSVVEWYKEIDLSKFKTGWKAATDYLGSAYSAVVSSQYVERVGEAINSFKTSMNSAYKSARGVAQEAGYAAEKWAAGTFNIDAAVRQSKYRAETPNSHKLGSADVTTNWNEEASLKYYQSASGSANAQAEAVISAYRDYKNKAIASGNNEPLSLNEYLDKNGYESSTQDALMSSIYEGQTRIIPADQLEEAVNYLRGRITKLSTGGGEAGDARSKALQETLSKLKDRLEAPDGTKSKPASYEEMQAIAELCKEGKFKPEDFGMSLSQVITPKYILKQAMGVGFESSMLRMAFTIGPDLVSIVVDAVKNKKLDKKTLKDLSIDGAVAATEGFVEGSVSSIVVDLCQAGKLGENLKGAPENVVGALAFLTIEAMIAGCSLAKGEISAEDYGWLIADKAFTTLLSIPVTVGLAAVLPGAKLFVIVGCMAGGIIASTGYTFVKEIALEFIDGGGFEAIIPKDLVSKTTNIINSAKEKIAELNISEQMSNLKDFSVSTLNDGIVVIKGVFKK